MSENSYQKIKRDIACTFVVKKCVSGNLSHETALQHIRVGLFAILNHHMASFILFLAYTLRLVFMNRAKSFIDVIRGK